MERQIKLRLLDKDTGLYHNVSTIDSPINKRGAHNFKGYEISAGYILRKVIHPKSNSRGYYLEHRLIMERSIGRLLMKDEIVHHLDGDRKNNNINNLELVINQSMHASIEDRGKRNPNGQFIAKDPKFMEKKYRLFDKDRGITKIYTLSKLINTTFRKGSFEYRGEWTGLLDKNGVEIYEGDKVRLRMPQRSTQTHTGDNIPLGSYTEPMEPIIETSEYIVVFNNGMFCLEDKDSMNFATGEDVSYSPLAYETIEYDLDLAQEMFAGGYFHYSNNPSSPYRSNVIDWNNEEEGDLQYLLETYNLESEDKLIKYLGLEIIGNIHTK